MAAPRQPAVSPATAGEFDLLQEMARTIVQAADLLAETLNGKTPVARAWPEIRDLEHKGDAIARDLFELLLTPRTTQPDVDSLRALTGYLDDVLDGIEAAAARLAIYRIRRAIAPAKAMGQVVRDSARELAAALDSLRQMRDVFPHTRTLHRLENRGDDLLREAIERLFAGRASPKDLLKWKDVFELLESATDRCEDIANVLETIVVAAGVEDRLVAGRLVMDVGRHEVVVDGTPIPLSAKEYALLHLLLRHQGKVVRRERLLADVWGEDYFGDSRTLDTHLGWLRKKVERRGGVRIVSVRGVGYRLDLLQ
ncbi:MAG TPA: DUF47 family protein [bacterium]|jgi:hypothetical protein